MHKRTVASQTLIVLAALYFVFVMNLAFWRFVWNAVTVTGVSSALFALSIPAAFFLAAYAFFSLLVWPYIGKAILAVLLVSAAAADYFMYSLNVYIDSGMMRNVFDTNLNEAMEMVTTSGVLWILLLGVVPAAVLCLARISYRPPLREAGLRLAGIAVALALFLGIGLLFFKEYSMTVRNNKMVGKLFSPANYVSATVRLLIQRQRANRPFEVIDENPVYSPYDDPHATVLVLMVGETARAMNFSLNGYARETNPRLAKQDVVNFGNVTSSGTATAFSLPCMFSHLPGDSFSIDAALNSENLLDILGKAGYDVVWLDNNSGSKGVATRATEVDLAATGDRKFLNGDACFDEVLLDGLEERLKNLGKNTLIVLHMLGSHGPSYYRRYPDAFRVFTPTADTAEIQNRPREEIVNAYDNTILYTDFVVSETIDILEKFPQYEAGMLYVSDHGESLGENNIYLHGFPPAFAPREQTHVPMILWMSETMKKMDHVDYEKLRGAAGSMKLSHDHLFHSLLGLLEIDSKLYDPGLDLFDGFRTQKLPFE